MVESAGAASRRGARLIDVVLALVAIAILIFCFVPCNWPSPELYNRTYCSNNLKQIGNACQQWATAHRQVWPMGYGEGSTRWDDVGNTRTDAWSRARDGGDPPTKEAADNKQPVQSNTASLWLLVSSVGLPPDLFLCSEAKYAKRQADMPDFKAVRDFRGESYCTYSYQNVLGKYRLTQTTARNSTQYAVAADANPMRRDFWSGAPGGVRNGVTDKMLAKKPAFEEAIPEEGEAWNEQAKFIRDPWELNSPNHAFKGQNVLYLDGHVEWRSDPYCGTQYDNIWLRRRTDVSVPVDPKNIETLRAYNDEASYDGLSTLRADSYDDSFLVP